VYRKKEVDAMRKSRFGIDFNAPFILGMAGISLAVLIVDMIADGNMIRLFAVYRTSVTDPMQYIRLFSHVLVHGDLAHYASNFMMILAIGPMVEEKYGNRPLCLITVMTALITGLVIVIFFPGKLVVGASGILFMMILLASFTNIRQGKMPITVPLVALLYIGNEIMLGLFTVSNVSRISHIVGGLCGACFGIIYHSRKFK